MPLILRTVVELVEREATPRTVGEAQEVLDMWGVLKTWFRMPWSYQAVSLTGQTLYL